VGRVGLEPTTQGL